MTIQTVRLVCSSGKTLTADLCGVCFEQMLHGDLHWEELKEEVIVSLPEPVKEEEPISNPPSSEEGEEFEDEPSEDFDSLDDALIDFLKQGRASVTEISEKFGIDKHETVRTLGRLRQKGEVKRAKGRGVWEAVE